MKFKKFLILLCLVLTAFLLSGCSNQAASTEDSENEPASYLTTFSNIEVTKLISYFRSSYAELYDKANSATTEEAAEIKEKISKLKTNIDRVDSELTSAVTDNTITNEVKQGYDNELETLKTDLDNLNTKLGG